MVPGTRADERRGRRPRALNRLLLPAFGRPTRATRTGRPLTVRSSSCRLQLVSCAIAGGEAASVAAWPTNSMSSSAKSSAASMSASRLSRSSRSAFERLGDAAGELGEGLLQVGVGAGLDDRVHGLGLRQVLLAGEERPQGELPRPGRPGPAREQVGDQPLHERRRAEGVELGEVLPGVGVRAGEEIVNRREQRRDAGEAERAGDEATPRPHPRPPSEEERGGKGEAQSGLPLPSSPLREGG